MTAHQPPDNGAGPGRGPRSVPLWVVAVIAVLALVAGGLAVAAVDRDGRAPLGEWLAHFVTTSGFAGLCAVLAASLALYGITRQVSVTLRGQRRQREADAEAAWWQRFEWASSRAVPASADQTPLPFEAVSSTLTALTTSATDDVQRAAVGAVMDVAGQAATQSVGQGSEDASDALGMPAADAPADQRRRASLRAYSAAAGGTPARSGVVDGLLYQFDVMDALIRILGSDKVLGEVVLEPRAAGPALEADAIVTHHGKRIVIELKAYSRPQPLSSAILHKLRHVVEASGSHAGLVVAPVTLRIPAGSDIPAVVWTSPADDAALQDALDRAADGPGPTTG